MDAVHDVLDTKVNEKPFEETPARSEVLGDAQLETCYFKLQPQFSVSLVLWHVVPNS